MMTELVAGQDIDQAPSLLGKIARTVGFLIVGLILVWAWRGAQMDPMKLYDNGANILEMGRSFIPPNFHEWRYYVEELILTIQMAIWGTVLAVFLAVPFGLLSSTNLVPAWVYLPIRRVLDILRSTNDLVYAMLFVSAVGLGPFAGVLALFVHTTGVLAKLFAEAVEAIDPQPVEGIRSTGAWKIEEIVYGVIPQVLPLWISYTLYRFEANVRGATVVGLTGAGGIGVVLWEDVRGFRYAETSAELIIIISSVIAIDLLSSQLRRFFI